MEDKAPLKEQSGPIGWMARNSVAANLLMFVLLVGGFMLSMQVKQEVFPEFELDMVTVSVPYPGASPAEVEQGIILAVEEEVRGIDGVKEVRSTASESMGMTTIELLKGANSQKASQDIKNAIDRITTFPEDSEEPQVSVLTIRHEVMSLILSGDQDEMVLRETAEQIRDRLLQDPDITLVELGAVRPLEISIEISQETLRTYDLTLDEVASIVRSSAVEVPGGGIKTKGGEILLRMMERRDWGRQFADIPIVSRPDGTTVRLEDIATILDGFEDVDSYATFNGEPAVMVRVYRVGDQTPIEVADAIARHVEELNKTLEGGLTLTKWWDRSDIYRQRVSLLLRNASVGLVLVLILLGSFLEIRLAFWVTMGIPISFLGAFLFLPLVGVSVNMVSLFAFILALGIVVDDAIVVGENVYEWHRQGLPFLQAAIRGAREVALPVVFSILTNIAAFMPMLFVPGVMGKVFRMIPIVVVLVFLVSLVESLFILPAHLGHHRDRERRGLGAWLHKRQQRFSDWLARAIRDRYGPFLDKALRNRYLTVACGVAILMITVGYAASGRLGFSMFPRVESDIALANAVLPYGTAVEITEEVRDKVVAAANEIIAEYGGDELVQGVFAQIGSTMDMRGGATANGGHAMHVQVFFTEPEKRTISSGEFVRLWRKKTGEIPGLESLTFVSDFGGPQSGAAITIELSHRSIEVLEQAGSELAAALRPFGNVTDINDGFTPGKSQFDFQIRPEGRSLSLTAIDVARQIRSCFYGAEALRQQRGRNEVKVMVRLPKSQRISEYDLEELVLRTPMGGEVLLSEAVEVTRGRAYNVISRREGRRIINVTADVDPPSQAGSVLGEVTDSVLPELMNKYSGLRYSLEGQQREQKESMMSLGMGFALAMMVIYALLAIPFGSYIQPLIIMVSIPFGIVGAVLGHIMMGYSLSVISMMGVVALSGVVVNDSLVLIDFSNRRRREGKSALEAVHSAGVRRFRPIILTSLTTFGGLAPMIFETSLQARFLIPMAISLGYGILFSTVIVLLLVPCLVLIVEDIRRFYGFSEPAVDASE